MCDLETQEAVAMEPKHVWYLADYTCVQDSSNQIAGT